MQSRLEKYCKKFAPTQEQYEKLFLAAIHTAKAALIIASLSALVYTMFWLGDVLNSMLLAMLSKGVTP